MASMITSAGSASGMDFESIISATLEAKKAQLSNSVTTKKEETNIQLSGVGKLKSALETFQKSIEALTEKNGFNTRKVTTNNPTENPYFTVTTKDDAANGNYNITVEQLSKTEKITSNSFAKDQKFTEGTLTFTLPPIKNDDGSETKREFTVDIKADDTLTSIRKKINNNDFGVNATVVTDSNGKQRLVIDSGVSGEDPAFSIKGTAGLEAFDYDASDSSNAGGNWDQAKTQKAQQAVIYVDGTKLTSDTNEFDNISGITINVNRVSEKDDNGSLIGNDVEISADYDAVTQKMQDFVNAYNTLMDTMDSLYKHNTYTDGTNNYDGGELSGDSMLRSLQTQIQNMMSNVSANKGTNVDIYSMGIEIDSKGKLSLNTTDFKDGLKDNFNAVVNLFSGDDGILTDINNVVEEYTKSNGILDNRETELNEIIDRYEEKEADNAVYLEEYEASLRQKYARLDTTIAGYNSSLNYLNSALY